MAYEEGGPEEMLPFDPVVHSVRRFGRFSSIALALFA